MSAQDNIVTTRQQVVDSIHQAFDVCFADWRVAGLRPRETVVDQLVFQILQGVVTPTEPDGIGRLLGR